MNHAEPLTFTLAGPELEAATLWQRDHACDFSPPNIPDMPDDYQIDFGYDYTFNPCGMGTAVTIRCQRCGQSQNVTDYAVW